MRWNGKKALRAGILAVVLLAALIVPPLVGGTVSAAEAELLGE